LQHLRQSLARSSGNLPHAITIVPYKILVKVIKLLSGLSDDQLWLRNSLPLNYWQLGLSDLDISIKSGGGATEALALWQKVKKIKTLSLGGEIQIYSDVQLDMLFRFCNFFEAKRDPFLFNKNEMQGRKPIEFEDLVFLMRMLLSDNGLRRYPDLRKPKWDKMFSLTDRVPSTPLSFDAVFNQIFTHPVFQSELSLSEIRMVFDDHTNATVAAQLVVAPNKLIIHASKIDGIKAALARLSPSLHRLVSVHQRWEIWGLSCMTPLTCNFSKENISTHIKNQIMLTNLLDISPDSRDLIVEGFSQLGAYYAPIEF
jgi:hypothetical protein